jgi:hypothetical protein
MREAVLTKPETVSEDLVAVEMSVVRVGQIHRACIPLRKRHMKNTRENMFPHM